MHFAVGVLERARLTLKIKIGMSQLLIACFAFWRGGFLRTIPNSERGMKYDRVLFPNIHTTQGGYVSI
jgi:hypothetical protein